MVKRAILKSISTHKGYITGGQMYELLEITWNILPREHKKDKSFKRKHAIGPLVFNVTVH